MMRILSITAAALVVGSALFSPAASANTGVTHEGVQLVSSSPPAGVLGDCFVGGWICGHVYNDDNNQPLRITTHWPDRNLSSSWKTLRVGQNSHGIGVKDADGFYIPGGCRATVAFVQNLGPGWYKVRNGQRVHVTDIVC